MMPIHILWLCSYIVLCLVLTWVRGTAQAATPEQIFARAAPSVVVVEVVDEKGRPPPRGVGWSLVPDSLLRPVMWLQAGRHLRVWHAETPFAATLGYADPEHDLCQVHTPKLQAPPVTRGAVKNLAVGQSGLYHQCPAGTESDVYGGDYFGTAPRPRVGFDPDGRSSLARPQAGVVCFDRAGRLIGMPCFQLQEGQQLNFALPVD